VEVRSDFCVRIIPRADYRFMKPTQYKSISTLCFVLGFASILGSIAIWFFTGGPTPEAQAHAERFGIFVGLWAPTFFILSNRLDRYAEKLAV